MYLSLFGLIYINILLHVAKYWHQLIMRGPLNRGPLKSPRV